MLDWIGVPGLMQRGGGHSFKMETIRVLKSQWWEYASEVLNAAKM